MTTEIDSKMTKDGCERIGIGSRVRCNSGFAAEYVEQLGVITDTRVNAHGERLWTVTFDTPRAPARNWSTVDKLAAQEHCYDVLTDVQPAN
jgi:hypothetical protein